MRRRRRPPRLVVVHVVYLLACFVVLPCPTISAQHSHPRYAAQEEQKQRQHRQEQQRRLQHEITVIGGDDPQSYHQDDDHVSEFAIHDHDAHSSSTPYVPSPNGNAALRQHLLRAYDARSFPFEHVWQQQQQQQTGSMRKGLQVEVSLNFHRVLKVDVTQSVADLVVWVRQQWHDPRLVWNPASYHNITSLQVWIQEGSGVGGETSEIWTPDLQLWNLQEPLETSLASSSAIVHHDGTVFWSRPGHLRPVCKFFGLDDFPFDTLQCTLEIGSWAYSGLYLRPVRMGTTGYTVGGSETAGEAFSEFKLQAVDCQPYVYPPFVAAPEEDWPVLFYHLTFQRSWQPYARGYLVLQVVLNVVAFTCFWLPPHLGERMGLSITAMLSAVASDLVVANNVPFMAEKTWFSRFSLMSLLFAASVLIESAVVIYFHYHTGKDLRPQWFQWIQHKWKQLQFGSDNNDDGGLEDGPDAHQSTRRSKRLSTLDSRHLREQSQSFRRTSAAPFESSRNLQPTSALRRSSLRPSEYLRSSLKPYSRPPSRNSSTKEFVQASLKRLNAANGSMNSATSTRTMNSATSTRKMSTGSTESTRHVTFGDSMVLSSTRSDNAARKKLLMEQSSTANGSGSIPPGRDSTSANSFDGYHRNSDDYKIPEDAHHFEPINENDSDDDEEEVVEEKTTKKGVNNNNNKHDKKGKEEPMSDASAKAAMDGSTNESIRKDADDFKNEQEMLNNLRWQKVAHAIDDVARVVFPISFAIALSIVLVDAENFI